MWFLLSVGCGGPRVVHVFENEENKKQEQDSRYVKVKEVISGDKIVLKDGRIVKYLGLETFDESHPFFLYAYKANTRLVNRGGGRVLLTFERQEKDEKGNYLAYVFSPVNPAEEKICCFVNMELLLFGCARVEENGRPHRYKEGFRAAQQKAKENKFGIWGLGQSVE